MVPLVSVLIPCYNAERWVAQALESVLTQTWQNIEIIVVDDGSTDSSLTILKRFLPSGIKIVQQHNRGASSARNRALKEAQGEFIQFLDADDLLARDKIEIQMRRLSQGCSGFIASGSWGRFYDASANTMFVTESVWTDLGPIDWLCTSWSGGGMMVTHSWLTPRPIIEKAGYWDEAPSPVDDGEFFTRVVLNSRGILFCPEARSFYRSGIEDSWSKRQTTENIVAVYRSIEASTSHLLAKEDSPRTRTACASHYQRFIYDTYPRMPELISRAEKKVKTLGGTDHQLAGGSAIFRFLADTLGWKAARKIQVTKRKIWPA